MWDIKPVGSFNNIGLPVNKTASNVHLAISLDKFSNYLFQERQDLKTLFKTYDNVFSKSDMDLDMAKGIVHRIDTGNNPPIKSRAIRRSRASENC